ncbi:hypothetical protein LAV73_22135 [Lysinibacillus xylanilyticus]|uniref:hypothetical protein n=1 Tax=Lysinibacillus xylanilyticus TaxID=582475 RepID=UPI002B2407AB|nr:hypothetical protein [Lysinibacillus xylanilyticus]MEB2282630.1 hypothetical protein [Lysinibacillus xylanilyticus]
MKKLCFLILMMFVLVACSTNQQQEIHYIAKSEHWKAVYHSNTDEGLQLFYLGEEGDLGGLEITIEGSIESQNYIDYQVNKDKQLILKKKESAKIFKKDAAPTIHIKWLSHNETLEVRSG